MLRNIWPRKQIKWSWISGSSGTSDLKEVQDRAEHQGRKWKCWIKWNISHQEVQDRGVNGTSDQVEVLDQAEHQDQAVLTEHLGSSGSRSEGNISHQEVQDRAEVQEVQDLAEHQVHQKCMGSWKFREVRSWKCRIKWNIWFKWNIRIQRKFRIQRSKWNI
jgi:hypothetical protein